MIFLLIFLNFLKKIIDDVNTKSKRGTDNPIFEPDEETLHRNHALPSPPSPKLVAEILSSTTKTTDEGVTSFIIEKTSKSSVCILTSKSTKKANSIRLDPFQKDKGECQSPKVDYKFDPNMTSIINKAHHLIIDTTNEKCHHTDGQSSSYESENYLHKTGSNKRVKACQLRLLVWILGFLAALGIIAVAMYYFVRYSSQQQYLLNKYREQYEKYEFESRIVATRAPGIN